MYMLSIISEFQGVEFAEFIRGMGYEVWCTNTGNSEHRLGKAIDWNYQDFKKNCILKLWKEIIKISKKYCFIRHFIEITGIRILKLSLKLYDETGSPDTPAVLAPSVCFGHYPLNGINMWICSLDVQCWYTTDTPWVPLYYSTDKLCVVDCGGWGVEERETFQEKADDAGVIIAVLSPDFIHSRTCQQQVVQNTLKHCEKYQNSQ